MTTLFISDLHLDEARPQITALFVKFLAGEARAADALYILGDLFEAWIGDDDYSPLAAEIAHALRALADSGVPIFYLHGNRDFLLGEAYARRSGMRLLPDPSVIDLYGTPVLISHGDALCVDDVDYQRFRSQVRDAQWQAGFLAQPLTARRAFAAQARAESQRHTAGADTAIMDVNAGAVLALLREARVSGLIHGHTHRPYVHALDVDGVPASRIVLGDWYEQGSVLRVDAQGFALSTLR